MTHNTNVQDFVFCKNTDADTQHTVHVYIKKQATVLVLPPGITLTS